MNFFVLIGEALYVLLDLPLAVLHHGHSHMRNGWPSFNCFLCGDSGRGCCACKDHAMLLHLIAVKGLVGRNFGYIGRGVFFLTEVDRAHLVIEVHIIHQINF